MEAVRQLPLLRRVRGNALHSCGHSRVSHRASSYATSRMPDVAVYAARSAGTSVQIICSPRYVVSQAESVVAYQLLGSRGVAGFQRLDDGHVVADRALEAIVLDDGLPSDHPHVGEQILGQRQQHAVAREPDDALVEL